MPDAEDQTDAVAHGPPGWEPWPDNHELTQFQSAVVDAVEAMSIGELATYDDIAHEIDRPGSAQAVSNVLRHAPDLPWWRILPSNGRLYRTHEPSQRPLLEAEGHTIDAERRVLPTEPHLRSTRRNG